MAKIKAEEPLIILDGPLHEDVVVGGRVGRLNRGCEGVQRDELGRVIRQAGAEVASLGRPCPSVGVSITLPRVDDEPDGRRRTGGCRGRRRGALASDPVARNGASCFEGPDHGIAGVTGRAPRDILGEPDGVVDGHATGFSLRMARGELGDGFDPPRAPRRAAKATMARRGSFFKSSVVYWVLIMVASR